MWVKSGLCSHITRTLWYNQRRKINVHKVHQPQRGEKSAGFWSTRGGLRNRRYDNLPLGTKRKAVRNERNGTYAKAQKHESSRLICTTTSRSVWLRTEGVRENAKRWVWKREWGPDCEGLLMSSSNPRLHVIGSGETRKVLSRVTVWANLCFRRRILPPVWMEKLQGKETAESYKSQWNCIHGQRLDCWAIHSSY